MSDTKLLTIGIAFIIGYYLSKQANSSNNVLPGTVLPSKSISGSSKFIRNRAKVV